MKLSNFVKTTLNMALRKPEMENPLLQRIILTFKRERPSFCSKSNVKFKFSCLVFMFYVFFMSIDTPGYKLAKFLLSILSSLTVNDYTVKSFLWQV